jgi:hypothetical protein
VLIAQLQAPCPQLDDDDNCTVYQTRPWTCRAFPKDPAQVLGMRCSYWFERDGQKLGGSASPHPASLALLLRAEMAP